MNNDNVKDNSSKQILLSVLWVAILVVAVVGVSFAAFTFTGTGTKENRISTGTISMTYSEDTNGIFITNALPTDVPTLGGSIHGSLQDSPQVLNGNTLLEEVTQQLFQVGIGDNLWHSLLHQFWGTLL